MSRIPDPFVSDPPAEIPLADAPLVRVLVQVRFPEILSIERREFVAPFQEDLRATYPVLRQEQTQSVTVNPDGSSSVTIASVWRFADVEGHWRVSLSAGFLTLETARYDSREDLLARLRTLLEALDTHFEPRTIDRVGVRYVDRIVGEAVDDIGTLVHPDVRGVLGTEAARHAEHSLQEAVFDVGEERVLARWGLLPPGASVDPTAIEPVDERSWILDLDMFGASGRPFVVDDLVETVERFAKRIYTVFRWAVTDDFLRRYGGIVP